MQSLVQRNEQKASSSCPPGILQPNEAGLTENLSRPSPDMPLGGSPYGTHVIDHTAELSSNSFLPLDDFQSLQSTTSPHSAMMHGMPFSAQELNLITLPHLMNLAIRSIYLTDDFEATSHSAVHYDYMDLLYRSEMEREQPLLYSPDLDATMEISSQSSWKLQDSYFSRVHKWIPLMDRSPTWLEYFNTAESSGFRDSSLDTAIVLLTFSLGAIAEAGETYDLLPGLTYFQHAVGILSRHALLTSLKVAQCYILISSVNRGCCSFKN